MLTCGAVASFLTMLATGSFPISILAAVAAGMSYQVSLSRLF